MTGSTRELGAYRNTLAPGAAVQDSVTLWNYSDIPVDFDVYATDAFNTQAGGFDVLDKTDEYGRASPR